MTGLYEDVGNVGDDGFTSFAIVSDGIDRSLFLAVLVGERENGN